MQHLHATLPLDSVMLVMHKLCCEQYTVACMKRKRGRHSICITMQIELSMVMSCKTLLTSTPEHTYLLSSAFLELAWAPTQTLQVQVMESALFACVSPANSCCLLHLALELIS